MKTQSLGRDAAIALAETGWWKTTPAKEVVLFQLRRRINYACPLMNFTA